MGNCLKRATTDDISLLRGSDSVRETSSDQLGPSPYQVKPDTYSKQKHLDNLEPD